MDSLEKLKCDVTRYLATLERRYQNSWNIHGRSIKSKLFKDNSYRKAACKEILKEIKNVEDIPFKVEAIDILMMLKNRYDSAPGTIQCFSCGADIIDDFINGSLIDFGEEVDK